MDPTLAPGYVPPSKGKEKAAKGHHWAEVQKKRTRTTTVNSENGDTSSTESTPPLQATVPSSYTEMPRHPRITSWRAGRSALSDGEGIGGPADLEEVPQGVKRQALRLEDYAFPEHRLRTVMDGTSSHAQSRFDAYLFQMIQRSLSSSWHVDHTVPSHISTSGCLKWPPMR